MVSTTRIAPAILFFILVAWSSGAPRASEQKPAVDKVPITTASNEARQLYVQGRDLAEKLRATDARKLYEQAVAKDKDFALGYLGLANTAGTTKEFIDGATKAAAFAAKVSEGERHMLLGLEAQMKGNPELVRTHYTALVRLHPNDERAQNLLGNFHFGRQEYETAVAHYVKATTINPSFSQPYNQMGYAYRFLERFPEAERAFKKYIELIPGDPNPYDSYAELLMKIGRFDDSIKNYEKALAIDGNFIASHIGIGNNYLATGQPAKARTAFAKIAAVARSNGERRTARFWAAAAYVHEGAADKAIEELKAGSALSEADQDFAAISGDLNLIADILREAGRYEEAKTKYGESVAAINKASVPEEVKENARRNYVFEQGRLAVAMKDLATAKAKAAEYAQKVAVKKVPFEIQQHELAGLIAFAEKNGALAAQELARANQLDPRILYLTAVALQSTGDTQRAAMSASKAAKFNGLNFNYAFVRDKARKFSGT
jgi:tetratricopeptide (TPR) repeat protein